MKIQDTDVSYHKHLRSYNSHGHQTLQYIENQHNLDWFGDQVSTTITETNWVYGYNNQNHIDTVTKTQLQNETDCDYSQSISCSTTHAATITSDTEYSYDSAHNVIDIHTQRDLESDGVYDEEDSQQWTRSYDSQGNMTESFYVQDTGNDGQPEYQSESTWTYDSHGQLQSHTLEVDSSGTGSFYTHTIENWAHDNTLPTAYSIFRDENGDGNPEIQRTETWTYVFDSNDQMVEREYQRDNNNDQSIDHTESYIWTYDDNQNMDSENRTVNGHVTHREWINIGSDQQTTSFYKEHNGVITEEFLSYCLE